ncbi:hypothetical protein Y1Q_0008851 [Alligator mississippiensis]|uniref:Uncharacterized protein n=1 Tax=Alligator mississippiensis TaxID=8496 RepID=A0A151NB55_ALLMI|nr:hypothetical protein Y1Q_0008851 [Alligator mississippiensis]
MQVLRILQECHIVKSCKKLRKKISVNSSSKTVDFILHVVSHSSSQERQRQLLKKDLEKGWIIGCRFKPPVAKRGEKP